MLFTDKDILDAFERNADEGGRLLFERYYRPLVLFSGSFQDNPEFSEDIVQDVFYLFIKQQTYRNMAPPALSTYLFRCVKHACLNRIRDKKVFSRAELLKYEAIEEEAMTVSPELIAAIRKAIEALPEKTRAAVHLIVVEGKKYREAAEAAGVSVNTIKTLLNHGLKQLRAQFPDSLLLIFMVRNY